MEKFIKKAIWILGIGCVGIVLVINILFDARLSNDLSEHITINIMQVSSFVIVGLMVTGLYWLLKKATLFEKIAKKWKVVICIIALLVYLIAQVIWINYRQATPGWDSKAVHTIAVDMYEGDLEAISKSEYATKNPHQIPLAFMESLVFRVTGNTNPKTLQYINALCNVMIIIALGFIGKEILNKSKFIAMIIGMFFVSIALLSTFVYGDIIGLACSLWSVYFLIKYNKSEKWYWVLLSAVLMAVAMVFRKNMLIFMAAEVIYLLINIITRKPKIKKTLIDVGVIIAFILISFMPSKIIIGVIQNKCNLNNDNQIPTTTYLYIGMTDGYRGSGWYNDNAKWAWEKTIPEAKKIYSEAIVERVKELITNPIELIKFYAKKNISMYAENTYAALFYNQTYNFDETGSTDKEKDEFLISQQDRLQLYQKALIILIFACTLLLLIKNKKCISNDELLLLIIFMGGFIFHNLWEAKSRYIIPYLVVLIPLASKIFALKSISRNDGKEKENEKSISNSTSI